MNYSDWNLVIQHSNFDDMARSFSFNYKSLSLYGTINDTVVLWGINFFNDILKWPADSFRGKHILMQSGPNGYIQTKLLFYKDRATFTLEDGWAFPRALAKNRGKALPYFHLCNSSCASHVCSYHLCDSLCSQIDYVK
ncbi:unnamed protein product [Prunus brigantina]